MFNMPAVTGAKRGARTMVSASERPIFTVFGSPCPAMGGRNITNAAIRSSIRTQAMIRASVIE